MAEIVEFNPVDDNNTLFPEGMPPGDVNNDARAILGALARMWELISGALTTTGDANGYVVTPTGTGWGNLVQGLKFTVKAHVTSAADCTLAFAGNAAVVIRDIAGNNLRAGALTQGTIYTFAYTGSDWQLVGIGGVLAFDWAREGNTDLIPMAKTRVAVADLTFGALVAWPAGTSPSARLVATGDAILAAPTGVLDGDFYILTYVQGTTGGHSLVFNASYTFNVQGIRADVATDAAAVTVFAFRYSSDVAEMKCIGKAEGA